MNEKIKQLAEQAEEYADQFVYVQAIGFPGHKEKFNEKFAELIVRECGAVALNIGCGDIEDELLKHFGVE